LAGKKLDDEELCSYILAGLDYEYNSLVSSVAARVEPITLGELYSQLLAYETHLDLQGGGQAPGGQMQSSVNTASRGRGGFMRGRGGHNSRGGSNSGGRGRGDSFNKSKNCFPPCQLWAEPIIQFSSAISALILRTWEKRRHSKFRTILWCGF
jgi:hypothetical protein